MDLFELAAQHSETAKLTGLYEPPPFVQVGRRALEALLPPPREDPRTWVPQNVFFPAVSSATPRPYDFWLFPYHRGVWDAFCDPEILEISMQWATQLGKTALMAAMVCYIAAQDPAPTIWGGPDERLVRRAIERKLYPVLRASPETNRRLPPEHLQRVDEIDLQRMVVYAGPSGSVAALGDISAKFIFKNELDKWSSKASSEGDPAALIDERRKAFRRYQIVNESTPTEQDNSRIAAALATSDARSYHVPCPRCGEYQPLEFEQLVMPHDHAGRLAGAERCALESYYRCRYCDGIFADHEKIPAMQRGVWARAGEGVEPDGSVVVHDAALRRVGSHAGFTLSSLYSPTLSFGEIAREWSAAQGNLGKTKNFVNGWLARVWSPRSKVTSREEVLRHRGLEDAAGYDRDTCPRAPLACIAVCDVQEDCLWYTVWAWCRGRRRYLLRHGQLPAALDHVRSVLKTRYLCTADGKPFRASHCLIDSGDRTKEVYEFCARHGFTPLKGLGSTNRTRPIEWSAQGELNLLTINVLPFKDALADAIKSGNVDDPGCWRLFATCGPDFAEQLTAETRIIETDKYGRKKAVWVNKQGRDNHYWDCCVYTEAAALALSWQGLEFDELTEEKAPAKPAETAGEGREH